MLKPFGLALPAAMTSLTVLNGLSVRVINTSGAFSISTTGTKSFGSKLIFANSEEFTASGPMAPMPSV